MKEINKVRFEFLSRSVNESLARAYIAVFCAQADPTVDEVGDVKTAVSEAVTNAVVHAYPDTLGRVRVVARLFDDSSVEVVVRDWGVGIADVQKAREPLFTTGDDMRSGMGFTIMESFCDKIKVKSVPGKGTTITLRKSFSTKAGDGAAI
ncbi:MAG: anti-sigma F factor [Oscillospiraceae bacterium]|jgi:stage II sporulation protein AB (anti-sigma F factor)|nr:anti-sigma F factor [Oscillospiraceae bacterium]